MLLACPGLLEFDPVRAAPATQAETTSRVKVKAVKTVVTMPIA